MLLVSMLACVMGTALTLCANNVNFLPVVPLCDMHAQNVDVADPFTAMSHTSLTSACCKASMHLELAQPDAPHRA